MVIRCNYRPRSVAYWEDNVFTDVCHSFCPRWGEGGLSDIKGSCGIKGMCGIERCLPGKGVSAWKGVCPGEVFAQWGVCLWCLPRECLPSGGLSTRWPLPRSFWNGILANVSVLVNAWCRQHGHCRTNIKSWCWLARSLHKSKEYTLHTK